MPATLTAKLSPVAAEYLRNLDELEAARGLFLSEREKLLDSLGAVIHEAAGELRQPIASSGRSDTAGTYDVDIEAQYVALRAKHGEKRSSGYSVVLGSFLGHVGAQTLVWFHLKLNPAKFKRLELSALQEKLGAGAKAIGEGRWLYIRTSAQSGSDLDLDALSDEARRLPEMFAIADPWIATRYA